MSSRTSKFLMRSAIGCSIFLTLLVPGPNCDRHDANSGHAAPSQPTPVVGTSAQDARQAAMDQQPQSSPSIIVEASTLNKSVDHWANTEGMLLRLTHKMILRGARKAVTRPATRPEASTNPALPDISPIHLTIRTPSIHGVWVRLEPIAVAGENDGRK